MSIFITKTRLYNFDPLKPHFYVENIIFYVEYIIFLILLNNIDCGYSLEPPRRGVLTSTHNLCFEQKYEKYQIFLYENFHFLVVKFSMYLNRRVFVMYSMAFMTRSAKKMHANLRTFPLRRLDTPVRFSDVFKR